MKKLLLLIICLFPYFAFSQISVTSANGQNVKTLLETRFLGGGIEISNVRFNGQNVVNSNQIGFFTNPNTASPNVGLASGIVMASGDCVGMYNSSDNASPASDGRDRSLALAYALSDFGMSNASLNDVAVLQFDFVASGEYVKFDYVFASSEYSSYVCSNFNDVFGFFISGPRWRR